MTFPLTQFGNSNRPFYIFSILHRLLEYLPKKPYTPMSSILAPPISTPALPTPPYLHRQAPPTCRCLRAPTPHHNPLCRAPDRRPGPSKPETPLENLHQGGAAAARHFSRAEQAFWAFSGDHFPFFWIHSSSTTHRTSCTTWGHQRQRNAHLVVTTSFL